MSDIKMKVVNSTVGLGDTEYSLSDGLGMLKYDKPALDECCDIINSHDALVEQNKALMDALKKIKDIGASGTSPVMEYLIARNIAAKMLEQANDNHI